MKTPVIIGGVVVLVVAVIITGILFTAFKTLQSNEVGLPYYPFSSTLGSSPTYEGLHIGPPGYHFIVFSGVFKTLPFGGVQCLNKDGVRITLSISFQYRVQPSYLRPIVDQFSTSNTYEKILGLIGRSAIYDSCSRFNTSQFQSERGRFKDDLSSRLATKYKSVHCDITDLQVNDIQRPSGYESAIKAKESSREDIEVALSERPQKLTEAGTKKLAAETEADIIINEAETEARIATNQARSEASGILNDYTREAATYKKLKSDLSLDNEGMLAYLGIRTLADNKNQVYVSMKGPAKTSYP